MANSNSEAMQSLQAHVEDMRSLTLCKICLRPFFEPFILGCGHSFCYSCLRSWFGGPADRRTKKNCPDCRTDVKAEPAPNYLLREIAHLFISRADLLPEDESVAEHKKDQDEESQLLSRDKKGEGLFQGRFKRRPLPPIGHAPIRDLEDGVERCPVCTYEIEDGRCNRCGLTFSESTDFSESDEGLSSTSEMDHESLSESEDDESVVPDADGALPWPNYFHAIDIDEDEEDEDEDNESDVNQYDRHDDFIDMDDEVDMDDIDGMGDHDNYATDPATPYSDTESEPFSGPTYNWRNRPHVIHDSDEESHSTTPEPYTYTAPAPLSRSNRPVVISDDEDEDDEPDSGQLSQRPRTESLSNQQRFMMPDLSETNSDIDTNEDHSEEDADSDESDDSESDSGSGSEDAASDSGSDDSDATLEDNAGNEDENAEDESDDTVIPPQPKRIRQNRLQEHRDNRDRRSFSEQANIGSSSNVARGRLRISRVDGPTRNSRRGRLTTVY